MCFLFSLSAPSYRPTLVYDHDCFAVSKHPQSSHLFEQRTARLSPAVQVREETPGGRAATAEELSRILFCKSKGPARWQGSISARASRFAWPTHRTGLMPISAVARLGATEHALVSRD